MTEKGEAGEQPATACGFAGVGRGFELLMPSLDQYAGSEDGGFEICCCHP